MKYAFVAGHRLASSIRAMWRCLRAQPCGFCASPKHPPSKRAQEDHRQTGLVRAARNESGKVSGYRKLHDDLADTGESCRPNRVARLTRLAGLRAQIGDQRRPGQCERQRKAKAESGQETRAGKLRAGKLGAVQASRGEAAFSERQGR